MSNLNRTFHIMKGRVREEQKVIEKKIRKLFKWNNVNSTNK
jgi:hypothetical protein